VAKRMEVGAVVGAATKANVIRKKPQPGDIVVLLGGATGRDGIGGATGSSKEHNETSLTKCSSEVQKGNAPMERRIQRLFRNPECTKLIVKCNDFGAGGVSVAIGELADGIHVILDKVPVKYAGLNGTELAISESQERMACVINPNDYEAFAKCAYDENLSTTIVATVTEDPRLVLEFKGEKIVDIARSFLDTNGVRTSQDVVVEDYTNEEANPFENDTTTDLLANLAKDNVASQRGLVEMFDATIGKSTVLMPYGGKYQLTEEEASIQKLPVFGVTNTASALAFGYHPGVSKYSPYLGGAYSVVEALAKLVASGCSYEKARLTCQEYFERLNQDAGAWGKPTQALLGNVEAQMAFKTPAIGGKDSMSGTYKDIHVPPTLITFAITTEHVDNIISSEFKTAGNNIYFVKHVTNEDYSPNYDCLKANFKKVKELVDAKVIVSASTLKFGGLSEALAKMSFGNKLGVSVTTKEALYQLNIGGMVVETVAEVNADADTILGATGAVTGGDVVNITDVAIWEPNSSDHVQYIVDNNNKITWSSGDATKYVKDLGEGKTGFATNTQIPTYALTTTAATNKDVVIENIYAWDGSESYLEKQVTLQTDKRSESDYRLKDGVENLISTGDDSGNTPFAIAPNCVVRLRVYVWLEGQDVDCINYASHGGGVTINLGIVKGSTIGSKGDDVESLEPDGAEGSGS